MCSIANEPQKPNHILELYDFAESDDLMDIALLNATIKRVSPPNNSPSKKQTILAIFRNAREANKAVQSFKGVRFKIKTWEPLVRTNRASFTPPLGNGNNNKKNNKDSSLLFDYSMQVPYEGVKPSEGNIILLFLCLKINDIINSY